MPVGVKVTERDESLYSNSPYSAPCLAVIGTATKGPVGVPTLCINQKDLKAKFGAQNPNSMGLYAANYFLSEVNRCYYVRVAKDAVESKANVSATNETATVSDLLVLKSATPGTHLDGYSVSISNSTEEDFTLSVKDANGVSLVMYNKVSLDKTSSRYVANVLKDSQYVVVDKDNSVEGVVYTLDEGDYTLSGGNDGITGLTSSEYVAALDLISPSIYDIEFIATPGVTDASVILKGLQIAEKRGDSFYFVDPPSGLTYEEAVAWHNGSGNYTDHTQFNSSFGGLYWAWQYIYDEVNDQEVLVPPSVVVPPAFARNDSIGQPWYAPAGLTRGLLKNVLRSEVNIDSDVQDILYTDPNNINPIITHANSGLVVFGQKTLWRSPTSLNRVNVRRLITHIKHAAKNICQYLVFEPNDSTTWNHFQDLMDPILRNIKEHRGLYDYKLVKGEDLVTPTDIDNYRMPVQILIKPTKSAEFIPVDIVLVSTGTDLNTYNSVYAE